MSDPNRPANDDTYSEAETVARREAALKRPFATPHKPHKPLRGNTSPKKAGKD